MRGRFRGKEEKRHVGVDDARVLSLPPAHRLTMLLRSGKRKLDAYSPTFDPHLDIATVVFSHVQCVKTRVNLALVSKIWRDASKNADAYPVTFDFDALPHMSDCMTRSDCVMVMMDNDEALSLPYDRVVGLLGKVANDVMLCEDAAACGCVRLLKWARENNCAWSAFTCDCAAANGHLHVLKYLHENGCPWEGSTCHFAVDYKHWDCLQYAVDNKCMQWEWYAGKYTKHLR